MNYFDWTYDGLRLMSELQMWVNNHGGNKAMAEIIEDEWVDVPKFMYRKKSDLVFDKKIKSIWNGQEIEILKVMKKDGFSNSDIGLMLNRSTVGVHQMISRLRKKGMYTELLEWVD